MTLHPRPVPVCALALVLFTSCGEAPTTQQPSGSPATGDTPAQARALRLERDVRTLQASVERMESLELHGAVVEAVRGVLDQDEGGSWRRVDEWAFRTFELAYWIDWAAPKGEAPMFALDFAHEQHPYHSIVRYARMLESRGVDFLVVPVPLRTQVYPERLPGIADQSSGFRGIDLGHAKYLLALAEAGVEVVDLLPDFAAERFADGESTDEFLYHAFDRHWTPRGAALAATRIAQRIREFPWFTRGPLREGEDFIVQRDKTLWTPRRKPGLPESEQPVEVWLERVVKPSGGEAMQESDRSSPIVVLGDSFLNHFKEQSAGVDSLLCAQLEMKLDTIALPGGGSTAVWQALARRADNLEGKKLVVWLSSTDQLADPRLRFIDLFAE